MASPPKKPWTRLFAEARFLRDQFVGQFQEAMREGLHRRRFQEPPDLTFPLLVSVAMTLALAVLLMLMVRL